MAAVAVLAVGLLVPYLIHRSGSMSVPGWQGLVMPGPLSRKHAFLGQNCEACHTPHLGVTAEKCIACHAGAEAVLSKQSTVFHAKVGECAGCHVEHEGGERSVTMDHGVLVAAGHAQASLTKQNESVREAALAFARLLRPPHAEQEQATSLDCASCHSNRDPHRGLLGRECALCHELKTWKVASFRHPSPASTECAQCHQAPPSHYMMHFEMVSKRVAGKEHARVEQCYLCHTTDAWNSIRGVGWYKHH
ncbi:multiheme c-type cytochrome [Enterovirga aerilata]|uniref:Class III cytochrome C family protein n=1 Tax=Enterovirga aerilata TaxID=2730920 RepID=A0A849I3C0_9HYPH|nr:class III cytochrome C family protein [Enterovirga sp. DB1703]NNM73902.1 class III cytochrome C family protein [Enterovirga sp. DB1703]